MRIKMMTRLFIPLFAAAMAMPTFAQDTVQTELAKLRTLSAQVARLSAQLDNLTAAPVTAPAAAPEAAPVKEETPPAPRVIAAAPKVHIVVKGESLDKIAKLNGTTVAELQKLNKITDPKKLQVGQQLNLQPEKNN